MKVRLFNFLKDPFVHFLVLGALIYGGYGLLNDDQPAADPKAITITSGEIRWLQDSWQKRWKRQPTDAELEGLVKQHLRERVLHREAVSMGLDKEDIVVRRRLVQKLEFLTRDLIQIEEPTTEQLAAFLAEKSETYEIPARVTLTHVFYNPEQRPNTVDKDIQADLVNLTSNSVDPVRAPEFGDRFLMQHVFTDYTFRELNRLFGQEFSKQIAGQEPGRWFGPVRSGYGQHLIYVHRVSEARQPELDTIKAKLVDDWKTARRAELQEKFVDGILSRYSVTIEHDQLAGKLQSPSKQTQ